MAIDHVRAGGHLDRRACIGVRGVHRGAQRPQGFADLAGQPLWRRGYRQLPGRAPLREALRELVDQGILVSEPYKGFRVRPVSERDLKELYSMRTGLEKFAFTLVWPNRTEESLGNLDARYEGLMSIRSNGDQAEAIEREIAFHAWVYEATGNNLLIDHWSRLAQLVRIYMSLHHNLHGFHGVFGEMTTIYRDLANGDDLEAMLAHIDEHMMQGFDSVLRALP